MQKEIQKNKRVGGGRKIIYNERIFMQAQAQSGAYNSNNSGMTSTLRVTKRSGSNAPLQMEKIYKAIKRAAGNYSEDICFDTITKEVFRNIYDNVTTEDLEKALTMAAVAFIEKDPSYSYVAARFVLQRAYKEVFGCSIAGQDIHQLYKEAFTKGIHKGIQADIFDKRLLDFDLEKLAAHLKPERDNLIDYLGIQTLYERYFLKINKKKIELPQTFWMRIAMGLAINESNKEEWAIEFYNVLSQLKYVSSTPTLFHSGYKVAQLSSCYLSTIYDDLKHIFKCIGDNAQLSKWAGGIGNDWTNVRGTGALIKGIHATSQGIIPFMKLANDVVTAITRSGIRRGGTCAYLETWHIDVEDFLDLRRNTGDERRRTHDMNTANWIPDLFMKRVKEDADWTLFSPDETPDLHELYGHEFEKKYCEYEELARQGKMKLTKVVSAKQLWRKMLSRLFETGHPWITFKDPCNLRSPQDHVGYVNSSNLCTEITLNTSDDETAVCNLGSVNLSRHIKNGEVDYDELGKTIQIGIRMLDNVIDLNFYPTEEAENSNLRHRPIGLGQMGFQDALIKLNIPFSSQDAITFADSIGEFVSYHAILSSSQLAKERGAYKSFKGSKWSRNIFPVDTINILEKERGEKIECSREESMDWKPVREHVQKWGMRNSNVMAVAPTATISNIAGCYPCIEPLYKNLYVKSNVSGEFTIVNKYLVADLKDLDLWNEEMLEKLKYYDGNLDYIEEIPESIKQMYRSSFDIDPVHLIKVTAARGKWIDQSQSHNVFMQGVSGKKLDEIYFTAWKCGLKTTYYLRTLGASQIEKATLDASKYGFTQKREYKSTSENGNSQYVRGSACNPMDEMCESCQ